MCGKPVDNLWINSPQVAAGRYAQKHLRTQQVIHRLFTEDSRYAKPNNKGVTYSLRSYCASIPERMYLRRGISMGYPHYYYYCCF